MTPQLFDNAADRTELSPRGRAAARAVLVDGRSAASVAAEIGVTRQAVRGYVLTVLRARTTRQPVSWKTITVTVPPDLATKIRAMARAARRAYRPRRVNKDVDIGAGESP